MVFLIFASFGYDFVFYLFLIKFLLVPNSAIFKTHQNLTQIWGIEVAGQYSRPTLAVDPNEQYVYMMLVTSSSILELVIIHWDNGTIFQVLQTSNVASQNGWNRIIFSDSASKHSLRYVIFKIAIWKISYHKDLVLIYLNPIFTYWLSYLDKNRISF